MTIKEKYNILKNILKGDTWFIDCMIAVNGNTEETYDNILSCITKFENFNQYAKAKGWF